MRGGMTVKVVLLLSFCSACVLVLEGNQLQKENAILLRQVAHVRNLSAGDSQFATLRDLQAQIETLNKENKDLFKLRNEMGQLRRQKAELEKLRVENQELGRRFKEPALSDPQATIPSGYVAREAIADCGFATPEATVQTYFKALVSEDYARFNQCLAESWEVELLDLNSADAYRFREIVELWRKFPGYFLGESKMIDAATIELQVKTSAEGPSMPLTLQHVNNEWKLSDRSVKRE